MVNSKLHILLKTIKISDYDADNKKYTFEEVRVQQKKTALRTLNLSKSWRFETPLTNYAK